MAQAIKIVICIFLNLLSLVIISSGLRLKLTHRDSPNSPLYEPNLSDFERFNKNVEISQNRASYFHQTRLQNSSLRVPLKPHDYTYTVDIGLGTPVVTRTLVFDTGSHLTWTQCRPCIRCFKREQPPFNMRNSSSFGVISRKNKLSKGFTCSATRCFYIVRYYSGQFSSGLVAAEDFMFETSDGVSKRVAGMVFGCGIINGGDFGKKNAISGVFGMGKEPVSFARQLGARIKNRFSYCLTKTDSKNNTKSSYLRFGDEAVIKNGTNAQTMRFLHTTKNNLYLLNLIDISIGSQRLGLKQDTFKEGCVIDSGSSVSLLNENAFIKVEKYLVAYFWSFKNLRKLVGKEVPKGFVCYANFRKDFFGKLPDMTYHFEGADFHVPWENVFVTIENDAFCLAAMRSKNTTILGAYQQRNVRVVYDLKDDKLSFAPEDCSRDAV
ncbi:hypothetical protein ACP275_13G065200 [Erythranthe tilingii]